MQDSNGKVSSKKAFRRLFLLAKTQSKILLLATFFLILSSGAGLYFPKVVSEMVATAVASGVDAINHAALLLIVVFFVQAIAGGFRHYLFSVAGYRIVTDLKSNTFEALMKQEIAFYDGRKTGELMSRLSSDTEVLQNAVSVHISMGLRSLATAIGGIALMFWGAPSLAMVVLLVVPPLSIAIVWFGRVIRTLSKKVQDAKAKTSEISEETISGIRTVRSFVMEKDESHRYATANEDAFGVMLLRTRYGAFFEVFSAFFGYATIALVLWYGGRLVVNDEMGLDILIQFILYTMMVAVSLSTLGGLWAEFNRAIGAADRVFDILDRIPQIDHHVGDQPKDIQGGLRLKQVHFAYPSRPEKPALIDVSLEMKPGDIAALVGPSGSGKSTIASLIPRFYDPDSGEIYLDNYLLTELDPHYLRSLIGSVPQEPGLFSMSIRENIAYGRDGASEEEIIAAAKAANAHQFIESFPHGYDTPVGERGVQLSGGQKQRIAIARAILKNPRFLILDEATSALDAESEYLVKQALDRLMENRTTLIIAHRLSTVKDADYVIVLDEGAIVETGTHDELMAIENGIYRNLVERQFMTETHA